MGENGGHVTASDRYAQYLIHNQLPPPAGSAASREESYAFPLSKEGSTHNKGNFDKSGEKLYSATPEYKAPRRYSTGRNSKHQKGMSSILPASEGKAGPRSSSMSGC